jgi:DNA-binding response OmpR family regulator
MMPGKSGLNLLKIIKKNLDTPIILLTAKVKQVKELKGLELELMIIYQNHLSQKN